MNKADFSDIKALFAETDRRFQETDRRFKKTERMIQQLGKQFGEMGNSWGSYTEGLVWPSVESILLKDFKMDYVFSRAKSRKNGQAYEFDVFGYANGDVNAAVIVEIKGNAKEEGVEQLLEHLRKFPLLFPDHQGKKLYGMLAAVNVPDNVKGLLRKHGLHLICPHQEQFRLANAPDFAAKNYQLPSTSTES